MPLKVGQIDKYKVIKQTDIAYTLKSLDESIETEIFLHFNQCIYPVKVGDIIDAFLYYDQKRRLCATTETPSITTNSPGFGEVVSVINHVGAFVNIGIAKDILFSADNLPRTESLWPVVGDKVFCVIKLKTDQLTLKPAIESSIKEKAPLEVGKNVDAIVYKINDAGIGLVTNDYNSIFVHRNLIRKAYRIGECVCVKIIHKNDSNTYNGSLIANKEIIRFDDSDMILEYLKKHSGTIGIGDKSTPEEINEYFKISKGAFKRAIGNLYKKHLITITDYRINLIEENL